MNTFSNRGRAVGLLLTTLLALALPACSRDQKPIAEAVKPAQQTLEAAKGVEQTIQKAQENREAQPAKE